jgi:hypothetical protein
VSPSSLTPTALGLGSIEPDFFNGPWFGISRDGERLIIAQTVFLSPPEPPILYMNAADSVVHTNPAGLGFGTNFSLSETGSRLLLNINGLEALYDGSFNLVGSAVFPTVSGQASYTPMTGVVTPDGTRAYVLGIRQDANTTLSVTPRVFVFDATTTQTDLNVLGYFDIPDYPDVCDTSYGYPCAWTPVAGAVSIDGGTLFFAGDQSLLVVPVPSTLSTVSSTSNRPLSRTQRHPAATLWPLNVH